MSLEDASNRRITYLRLSLTDACPMRCVYCRPETAAHPMARALLSPDEVERLVAHLVERHGLRKVRLTGGEPTSRADLLEIIGRLSRMAGLHELVLSTNGLTLVRQASALAAAGLARVNVSLDSLRPERFARITGVDGLDRVLAGIEAAQQAGLTPVKLNCVVVRGENDDELPQLLQFAAGRCLEIRFIELMPMGPLSSRWSERYVTEGEMRRTLAATVRQWHPFPRQPTPARRYRADLHDGKTTTVGFITAMSAHFCDDCNRMRIASDATFYPCLMDQPAANLLPAIRPAFDGQLLDRLLAEGLSRKAAVHPERGEAVMVRIGG